MKVGDLIKCLEQCDEDSEVLCRRSHASLDIYKISEVNGKVYIECDWDVLKDIYKVGEVTPTQATAPPYLPSY